MLKTLKLALLLLLVCAFGPVGCGEDDDITAVLQGRTLSAFGLTPKTFTVAAGQTQQLRVQAAFSDGSAIDGTSDAVQWRSSNPAVATVNGSGLVTGVAPGSAAIEADFQGFSTGALVTVTGANLSPSPSPSGSPSPNANTRIFVANEASSAPGYISVFALDANGNQAPLRVIGTAGLAQGAPVGISRLRNPRGLNIVNNELYVLDGDDVLVFPLNASGEVAPSRSFTDAAIGNGLDMTVSGGNLFITDQSGVRVYPVTAPTAAGASVSPTRIIGNPVGGVNPNQAALAVASLSTDLLLGDLNGNLVRVPNTAVTGTAASQTYATEDAFEGTEATGGTLFVSDEVDVAGVGTNLDGLAVFNEATGALLRTIGGPATGLTNPGELDSFNNELFVIENFNSIVVLPTSATGNQAFSRRIAGALAGLSGASSIVIGPDAAPNNDD
jgi:hypothetical protein